jgi:TPR repeat protein
MRLAFSCAMVLMLSLLPLSQIAFSAELTYQEALSLAEQGNADAQNALGMLLYKGEETTKNTNEALKWFHLAANQGNIDAQVTLGLMYYYGEQLFENVSQNFIEAAKWFELAAKKGDADAQYLLGTIYVEGKGIPKDYAKALELYRLAAEQGSDEAQKELGMMYANGDGVEPDLNKAIELFSSAAEKGNGEAASWLGIFYFHGIGVSRNIEEAIKWLSMADSKNIISAKVYLGLINDLGLGIEKNESEALRLYKSAADGGNSLGDFLLATIYSTDGGVFFDLGMAKYHYKIAAGGGIFEARDILESNFFPSWNRTNFNEILNCFKLSVFEVSSAQYEIGRAFWEGGALGKDYDKAVFYWRKAKDNGHKPSEKIITKVDYYEQNPNLFLRAGMTNVGNKKIVNSLSNDIREIIDDVSGKRKFEDYIIYDQYNVKDSRGGSHTIYRTNYGDMSVDRQPVDVNEKNKPIEINEPRRVVEKKAIKGKKSQAISPEDKAEILHGQNRSTPALPKVVVNPVDGSTSTFVPSDPAGTTGILIDHRTGQTGTVTPGGVVIPSQGGPPGTMTPGGTVIWPHGK